MFNKNINHRNKFIFDSIEELSTKPFYYAFNDLRIQ